jgi:hypothetical protein
MNPSSSPLGAPPDGPGLPALGLALQTIWFALTPEGALP